MFIFVPGNSDNESRHSEESSLSESEAEVEKVDAEKEIFGSVSGSDDSD